MSIIDSIINVFNKNKGVVITMTDSDIVTALNALPILSKPAYYWFLDGVDKGSLLLDPARQPLLNALVRTTKTGCLSVEWSDQKKVNNMVAACKASGNATIGLLSSPYQNMATKKLPATDYGTDYQLDITNLKNNLTNLKNWIDTANKNLGSTIQVSLLHFDVELWLTRTDSKPDMIKKYNAIYSLAKKIFPNIKVVFYQYGAQVYWPNDTGIQNGEYELFTYDPTEPGHDHCTAILYQPVEPFFMQHLYDKTCDRADSMGIKDVFAWISLGSTGYRQGAGWIGWSPTDTTVDYPLLSSWVMGFQIFHPWAAARPLRFGKMGQRCPAVFLYPPPFSIPQSATAAGWALHFLALVKGCNNIPL